MLLAAAAAAAPWLASPRLARACSLPQNAPHVVDPAAEDDLVAPSAATVTAEVKRSSGGSSCDDTVLVTLTVSATDDRAPTEQLGYALRLVSVAPGNAGLQLPGEVVRAAGGRIVLAYSARSPGYVAEVEVRAADLNGNLGPPAAVTITDPGADSDDGGCSAAGGEGSTALVVLGLSGGLALGAGRRRRRRRG